MKKESNNKRKSFKMKALHNWTVLYRSARRFETSKTADYRVYTFECPATSADDAIRQLKMSRMFSTRSKSGKTHFRVRRFKVVRVYTGDPIGHCDCEYCKANPDMSRKIKVLPTKVRASMFHNFYGKKSG